MLTQIENWFASRGWAPFGFQREVWQAYLDGDSGLIHASTGTGKTYAAWLGPLMEAAYEAAHEARAEGESNDDGKAPRLRVLWITPLRALAADTEKALREPLDALGLNWTLERRTGDTSSSVRARQKERLPTALITTPESLSLFLSQANSPQQFQNLRCVVVDEWHELMGTKRGVQTELCLARLRQWNPNLRTWGLSATMGNLDSAMAALMGWGEGGKGKGVSGESRVDHNSLTPLTHPTPLTPSTHQQPATQLRLIRGEQPKAIVVDSLIPAQIERFPWTGHLGLRMLEPVVRVLEDVSSALVFTNTRSQTEIWYQNILEMKPDWAGEIALHHGSLDRATRDWVENGLRHHTLHAVVCTSSLDLGVDFAPVDRVLQIGSPKGIARLMQRAGRSGHRPGATSRVTCVPTNAFELVEVAAARDAIQLGHIEGKTLLEKPLDVLAQHVVTIAAGTGFRPDDLFDEVRTAYAYRNLSEVEWQWVLDFVVRGGNALKAYPQYQRVVERDGLYKVEDVSIARMHRLSIGTIVSDAAIQVQFLKGARLGTIEESFVSRLKRGDKFVFAGRVLEFVMLHDNTALVRKASNNKGAVPSWQGSRMPLSTELCAAVRAKLEEARAGHYNGPEMEAVRPVLELQAQRSHIPAPDELLIERTKTRDGYHLFFFPFEGRAVHEGLSALFAYRLSRLLPITFTFAMNDYGFELLSADSLAFVTAEHIASLLRVEHLAEDILASLNSTEMARRQFREIARIAGLVLDGLPGKRKTSRQVQASSSLIFDVFAKYDPQNLLLHQANREVLERQLESSRLRRALERLLQCKIVLVDCKHPTPLAFPILVDGLREQLSSETLADRVKKMQVQFEKS